MIEEDALVVVHHEARECAINNKSALKSSVAQILFSQEKEKEKERPVLHLGAELLSFSFSPSQISVLPL